MRIGLISDTHGFMRPEALDALRGCDRILHAGDVGGQSVLDQLAALAPVVAVRGNNDRGDWAGALRDWESVTIGAVRIGVVHDRADIDRLGARGLQAIVYGHSHVPRIEDRAGTLLINPGSAGPKRFDLPVSVGELVVEGATLRARLIALQPKPAPRRKR